MKKLVPFLMMLLVLFWAAPHAGCLCKASAPKENKGRAVFVEAQSEHSCCQGRMTTSCKLPDTSFSNSRNCCGMNGYCLPMANNSPYPAGQIEQANFQIALPCSFDNLQSTVHRLQTSKTNRAPPYIVGLGSSKTYLFKQTLLI